MDSPTIGQPPPLIHVAIVEDDLGFSRALAEAIASAQDIRLAGTAGTRAEGLSLLQGEPTDVLLVDLGLPDGSGIDVIKAAVRLWPSCSVMVSTNFGDEVHVIRSIEAGASGYLLKDSTPARIVDEIRSVASGGSPISPIIARQVLARFRQIKTGDAARTTAPEETQLLLSAREKEVLELITKGFTANEIAKLMSLSPFTVRSFVRRIYSKLNVTSKAEAIYEARNQGILDG
ncbi:response regulator transcription factor [Dyella sp. GSA-30]|uniref:response regulator n=1 Tax=Dyella sp. GSA-30 TaxID=2994496 RepID=UPI002492F3A4|nr:response regulator transcription factor [Dyella sp. GSA-30]BDU21755.1 DNA-binding response regulator [Dyella sp. GSA-30]